MNQYYKRMFEDIKHDLIDVWRLMEKSQVYADKAENDMMVAKEFIHRMLLKLREREMAEQKKYEDRLRAEKWQWPVDTDYCWKEKQNDTGCP